MAKKTRGLKKKAKAAKASAKKVKASAKSARKAKAGSTANNYKGWSASDVRELRRLARENTAVNAIGRKLGRTEISIRGKAQREGISLRAAGTAAKRRKRR